MRKVSLLTTGSCIVRLYDISSKLGRRPLLTAHLHQRVERLLMVLRSSKLLLSHTSKAADDAPLPPAEYALPPDIKIALTGPACTHVSFTRPEPGAWDGRQLSNKSLPAAVLARCGLGLCRRCGGRRGLWWPLLLLLLLQWELAALLEAMGRELLA